MPRNSLNYPVEFAADVFGSSSVLAETLRTVTGAQTPRVLIVADQNVVQHTADLGTKIGRYVQANQLALAAPPVVLSGGERCKADAVTSVMAFGRALLAAELGADGAVIALGGGALLDVAGFVTAQMRGGVKLVRMPTTPAAMMGAAFADCAAVNCWETKNALQVPSIPTAVVIDPGFAATVLDGVWRGGVGEAVRLATVTDAPLLRKTASLAEALRRRDPEAMQALLTAAVKVRQKKRPGAFAEWIALRLEELSGFKLPHGYAVAIAVSLDTAYAEARGYITAEDLQLVRDTLAACGALEALAHSVRTLMRADELLSGVVHNSGFVLPSPLGKARIDPELDFELYRSLLQNLTRVV